jgi:hypothetical protein
VQLNTDYYRLTPARKLQDLLARIVDIQLEKDSLVARPPHHSIPDWAMYMGGACIALAVISAAVGQWISSKSRGRCGSFMIMLNGIVA